MIGQQHPRGRVVHAVFVCVCEVSFVKDVSLAHSRCVSSVASGGKDGGSSCRWTNLKSVDA